MNDLESLATIAVDCGFHIHKELGPGLLEGVYESVLADAIAQHIADFSIAGIRAIGSRVRG